MKKVKVDLLVVGNLLVINNSVSYTHLTLPTKHAV